MSRDYNSALHQQETDFAIVKLLLPHVQNRTFLDIGAEKGTFTELLISHHFTGMLFEPLPKHERVLKELTERSNCIYSSYAIDDKDGTADFHIACDIDTNDTLDYFHSLHPLKNDARVHHTQKISVNCRSLNSLYREGTIKKQIGIIKTDTEGNDLHVLRGMTDLESEILVCEYFMPGIYSGWEQGNAYNLIDEAIKLGFEHYIAINRVNVFEFLSIDSKTFLEKQWGNLIFIKNNVFKKSKSILEKFVAEKEVKLIEKFLKHTNDLENEVSTLRKACDERLALINNLNNNLLHNNTNHNESILATKSLEILKKELEVNAFKSKLENDYLRIQLDEKEKIIQQLKALNDVRNINFVTDLNKHFTEIYSRFIEIQQQIIRTSKSAVVDFRRMHIEIQKERVSLIDPLKKVNHFTNSRSLLNKIQSRIDLFFTPKLGELNLYPSRPLMIPERYKKIRVDNKLPFISIVTPSYNHGSFLERTIKSVIDQQYPHLEYIIQDGNSNDETIKIIKRYESSLKHWDSAPDNGQSHAINLGFKHATGEIMAYLNSDDILLPGSLHYIGTYFNKHPEVDVIYGHRILIDENDHEIGRWVLPPHDPDILSWADYIPQETLFWRKSLWEKIGSHIDETFRFAMDWDLLLRFRDAGAKFVRLPRFLGMFRIHPHQKTSAQISETGIEEMDRIRERCHGRKIACAEIAKATRSYLNRHLFYHKFYRIGILRY
ncbi:MAG: FkbM family methyltransferase [Gammaproteobacteria bacterium]